MMVQQGEADAFVSGLTYEYPEVIRPGLQIFHTRPGVKRAASAYVVIIRDDVFVFSDATVNIEPTAEDLAEIAALAADFAADLGLTPRVAMLSFSNFGSVPHPLAEKPSPAPTSPWTARCRPTWLWFPNCWRAGTRSAR